MMIRWRPLLVMALLLLPSGPPAAASTWPARPDSLTSSTVLSSELVAGSIRASRHVVKPKSLLESLHVRERLKKEDHDEDDEPSKLSWDLGYGFARNTDSRPQAQALIQQALIAGLGWEAPKDLRMGLAFGYTAAAPINFQQGGIGVRFEYSPPRLLAEWLGKGAADLKRDPVEEMAEENEARVYYRKLTRPPPPPPPLLPRISFGLDLEFFRNLRKTPAGESAVSEFRIGPRVAVDWTERLATRLGMAYFGYSEGPEILLSETSRSRTTLPVSSTFVLPFPGSAALVPDALSFPQLFLSQELVFQLSSLWTIGLGANQVLPWISGQPTLIGIAPFVYRRWGQNVEIGLGGNVLRGGASTTFLGVLDLVYRVEPGRAKRGEE